MGEPITLVGKDGKPVTVYGASQAAELLADGYSLLADQPDTEPSDPVADSPVATKRTPRKRPGKTGAA